MKTSTYILSTSQKWIFAIVITLAVLFAGCNDSPTGESIENIKAPLPQTNLEGYWIELSLKGQPSNAWLNLTSTSGIYTSPSDDKVVMNFEYEKVNENVLRIIKTKYMVNGIVQPSGKEEDIFYKLSGNTLRIFDRNFIRAGEKVDLF